jgi:hypothetical protein
MTCMSHSSDAGLWYALNRLETNYWWDVDLNGGRNAHEFYLPLSVPRSAAGVPWQQPPALALDRRTVSV